MIILPLAACAVPTGSQPPSDVTDSPASTASPSIDPTGPQTPQKSTGSPAISVASLPIGGNASDDTVEDQCVRVSWLQKGILQGLSVVVTDIQITPQGIFKKLGRCEDLPPCDSFTFRPGSLDCSVGVRALGTNGHADLTMKGKISCPPAQDTECADLRAQINGNSIGLNQPSGPEQPPSSSTSSPPSSTS